MEKMFLEGPISEVFVRTDVLREMFIEPPQITKLSRMLSNKGFPPDMSVEEMYEFISSRFNG